MAYSGAKGGALSLQAQLVQIGGVKPAPDTLWLTSQFFDLGGFSTFSINGLGRTAGVTDQYVPAITIAAGTILNPVAESYIAMPHASPSGTPELIAMVKPSGIRSPVTLNFNARGVQNDFTGLLDVRGDFFMANGAVIGTDPQGTVSIVGDTVTVLGSIMAPGGTILISGADSFPSAQANPLSALPTVYLGSRVFLSTAGATILVPDRYGHRIGTVVPGGSITVSGNLVATAGALLNVSGASDTLDFAPAALGLASSGKGPIIPVNSGVNAPLYGSVVAPMRVDSNGGSIILKGGQELFTEAKLLGRAGGPTALGGSLSVSSGRFYVQGEPRTTADLNLVVSGDGFSPGFAGTGIGQPVEDGNGNIIAQMGYLATRTFHNGGFGSLTLGGNVSFGGSVSISMPQSLKVATGGVIRTDSTTTLAAPYVALGQPFHGPINPQQQVFYFTQTNAQGVTGDYNFLPTFGPGSLTVTAELLDIGILSLQNTGQAHFTAHDLRGDGAFDAAGDLALQAGQIYPATATNFIISAYDHNGTSGSITIAGSGNRSLPWSAGGELDIYASTIIQGGVLRAPVGTINLGWDGTGIAPSGLITGQGVAKTLNVTLASGSVTSVAAVDSRGLGLSIPYGASPDGRSWIDPRGVDITAGGVSEKAINVAGMNVTSAPGAVIDLSGGGNLYAYRWIAGNGGSTDILALNTGFAVIPGYDSSFAPYAPFNSTPFAASLLSDPGYMNNGLAVGDQIYLSAGSGLSAGTYTLLPARYALLPGAYLITPKPGTPIGTVAMPDGSTVVTGYRYNGLADRDLSPIYSQFEVASGAVVRERADYEDYFANSFLLASARQLETAVPRLPIDAGQLVLRAAQTLQLNGFVRASAAEGHRGGLVDISSPADILIARPGLTASNGVLVLDSTQLSSFGAESLLIGGIRSSTPAGTAVSVQTGNLTVDNAGAPLTAPDLILVASNGLTLAAGAKIEASERFGEADTLLLSGNGTMVRVSSNPAARTIRTGANSSTTPLLTIGAGAEISGGSVTLDSTQGTLLDPTATLTARNLYLNSGRISLVLENAGVLPPVTGLVLSGPALQSIEQAESLSLQSYSSIDTYGSGQVGSSSLANLELHTGQIRGFTTENSTVAFSAANILLDNASNSVGSGTLVAASGNLDFDANVIRLGANSVRIDQYAGVGLLSPQGLFLSSSGSLITGGALDVTASLITSAPGISYQITSNAALSLLSPVGGVSSAVTSGLGAALSLTGASVAVDTNIVLPTGQLSLRATTGDILIGGTNAALLDAGGTRQSFFDLDRYTDGGRIGLFADNGKVTLSSGSTLNVAAQPGAGSAGTVSVAAKSIFTLDGAILGMGGAGGKNGSFALDTGSLGSVAALAAALDVGGFTESRSYRVRAGDVTIDGLIQAHNYSLSLDGGSIIVGGTIDASGVTGGTISLIASGGITLQNGSLLSVKGDTFDDAGKGGSVSLEAGAEIDGVLANSPLGAGPQLAIQSGSTIELSVAAISDAVDPVAAAATAAFYGKFSGTLRLRAPQAAGNTDLQITPIAGSIIGASSLLVEGYQLFNLTQGGVITSMGTTQAAGGNINSSAVNVQGSIKANGQLFAGNANNITNRLFAGGAPPAVGQPALSAVIIAPGAEVTNTNGNLTLNSDWDLSTYRFGPKQTPGVLTMRASGNLIFNGSLSDGFDPTKAASAPSNQKLWLAPLMTQNSLLPINSQSWSYRLTAGADFSTAMFGGVRSLSDLAADSGSLLLGKNGGQAIVTGGANARTSTLIPTLYQVIRTGSGDININAGRDVQLLNQFATIYTAGVAVSDPTTIYTSGDFTVPNVTKSVSQGSLGTAQQLYLAQYSLSGGNVSIASGNDIAHLTRNNSSLLVDDSERELPMNWLYRRGFVDPATGAFGASGTGNAILGVVDPSASTTWWVDFSNFFEGVGALGGGNVSLTAGHDVKNVDAVSPTNARLPGGIPDASKLVELGGGDVMVRAGHDINAGVYYVERGTGTLAAGNQITTNQTRSPSLGILQGFNTPTILDSSTWLPTTLFAGKSSFDVKAQGDLLLGQAVNPFLLPQGQSNEFYYKTYFTTYDPASSVAVTSLGGKVTLRESAILPNESSARSLLDVWLEKELQLTAGTAPSASFFQPWLRLAETLVSPFETVSALAPPTLKITSISSDVNVVGNLTLFPSATGTLEIAAKGSINGLQPAGKSSLLVPGQNTVGWTSSTINVSDASPSSVPGIASPFAYQLLVGTSGAASTGNAVLGTNILSRINALFNETGSYQGASGVVQFKQALHAPGLLHLNDAEPLRLYSINNLSGLTLYSPKPAQIIAGADISDIGFYIQNLNQDDTSIVSAGRDIVAYNANSPLRIAAQMSGNALGARSVQPQSGDLQIAGPGTFEILAGRNLDLGTGFNNADGTGAGITSIGNARNPYLPFEGAAIIAGAGVKLPLGLAKGGIDFPSFLHQILDGPDGVRYGMELSESLDTAGGFDPTDISLLSEVEKAQLALRLFYLVLRDAGRDHNDPLSPGFGTYAAGFSAIDELFGMAGPTGEIMTQSRDIRTKNGGTISLFAPGGGVTLASSILGNPLAPPGIVTEHGGAISIFTDQSVDVGVGRIFSLRGGDIVIWSSNGDIAAGASSKTVQSAPPTRVVIDPQSADVATDLAGLATGGGIGVLATVANVAPGNVDLIAPAGTVDAGDAGIRASGNLNIAAVTVLNASNISVGGASAGVPTAAPIAAPNIGGLTAASTAAGAASNAASELAQTARNQANAEPEDVPSIIAVEVLGYGGG